MFIQPKVCLKPSKITPKFKLNIFFWRKSKDNQVDFRFSPQETLVHAKNCQEDVDCIREFVNNQPIMITFDDIPKILKFFKTNYTLIGCTLYLNNHFISKVLIQNTCHVVDNLPNTHQLSFYLNSSKFWKITNLFYEYKD